ncbi:MAG: CRTAC1 family protein [Bacteriovoracales bacterium]|nr:CRTAC1 family protein [Bacteriovoracales bacterium]
MVAMDSIFSITKILSPFFLALVFVMGGGHGCSWRVQDPRDQSSPSHLKKPRAEGQKGGGDFGPIVYGPSLGTPKGGFVEKSASYGLEGIKGVRFYGVDFDGDLWTDLVVLPHYFSVPVFYRFSPQKKRFELLSPFPFKVKIQASFLNFVDLDRDGLLDVALGVLGQRSALTKKALRLFRARIKKGHLVYEEVEDAFEKKDQKRLTNFPLASLSALDFDRDGKLDFFLGGWFRPGLGNQITNAPDMLFKGDGFRMSDQSFRLLKEWDKKRSERIYPHATPTFASSTCDVDGNGYPDILTASSGGYANRMWLGVFDSTKKGVFFTDFAVEAGYDQDERGRFELRGGGHTFFTACADYNNDSVMDIFLGELFHAHDSPNVDRSAVLTGKHHTLRPDFIRTPYTHDIEKKWSQGDRRGVWFDYNNDGLLDLLVDNSGHPPHSRLVLFHQNKDHSYVDKARALGLDIVNPVGSIVFDVNGDGRPDILSGQDAVRDDAIRPRLYLFENAVPRKGRRSLRFFLRGRAGNARALGALVTLVTDKGKRIRWVESHRGGQGSQNEEGVHFGLRKGEKALGVRVRWPRMGPKREERYKLDAYSFRHFLDLTLCEGGGVRVGRKAHCGKK